MKAFFAFPLILLLTGLLQAQRLDNTPLDYTELVEQSKYWPHYVHLLEPVETEFLDKPYTLRAGRRGTLIRLEQDHIVVDFGRYGIFELHPSTVDIIDQAEQIRKGLIKKEVPRLNWIFHNKAVDPTTEDYTIRPDRLLKARSFAFLYAVVDDPKSEEAIATVRSFYDRIKQEHPDFEVIFMPQELNQNELVRHWQEQEIEFMSLAMSLAVGYTHALHHKPQPFPALVFTDAEGKILAHSKKNPDDIEGVLKVIEQTLEEQESSKVAVQW